MTHPNEKKSFRGTIHHHSLLGLYNQSFGSDPHESAFILDAGSGPGSGSILFVKESKRTGARSVLARTRDYYPLVN